MPPEDNASRRNVSGDAMDLRKIQLTGGSSFTVTLPKEWVTNAELGSGDVVGFLAQQDGSLAIYPHARLAASQARYTLEVAQDDPDSVFRGIVAAYLAGFDVIVVKGKKPLGANARKGVRSAAKRIIGLETVEEDASSVTLQDFLDPKEFHIDKGLRRMQAITRAMQEDALRAFTEDLDDVKSAFSDRDDEVDRLYWMINKQYHAILRDPAYAQRMGLNASQALNYLMCARLIERTADHALRIAENVQALRKDDVAAKLESKIEKQARKAVSIFADSLSTFHKQDAEAANRIIEATHDFRAAQDALMRESLGLAGESILHVALALESIARTAAYAADVAETAINHRVAMTAA